MSISERYGLKHNEFAEQGFSKDSGSADSWFRVLYGATWKFIVHYNDKGTPVNCAAVKMEGGRGVRSHNFRP